MPDINTPEEEAVHTYIHTYILSKCAHTLMQVAPMLDNDTPEQQAVHSFIHTYKHTYIHTLMQVAPMLDKDTPEEEAQVTGKEIKEDHRVSLSIKERPRGKS